MAEPVKVLVVDDHALFRDGVASLLAARGYEVVGYAGDGAEALTRARELRPDLILMDIRMPVMGGLEATRLIRAEMPDAKVVMLTVSEDEEHLFEAIKSGAQGYLLKRLKADVFFELISGVMQGEAPVSPKMATRIIQEFGGTLSQDSPRQDGGRLSDREKEVLALVAAGKANKQIASELSISESTVKYHLRNILDKLHLESRAHVIAYAARRGLGTLPEGQDTRS